MAGSSGSFGGAGCAVALGRDALTATAEPFSDGGVTATALAAFAGSSGLTAVALIFPDLSFLFCLLALVMTDFSLALVGDDPFAAFATADSAFGCAFAGALAAARCHAGWCAWRHVAAVGFFCKSTTARRFVLYNYCSQSAHTRSYRVLALTQV